MSAALQDEPRTLAEMHAAHLARQRRMEERARNPLPGKPKPIELGRGELGARVFGGETPETIAEREREIEERRQQALEADREQYRATFAGAPETPRSVIARIAKDHALTPADITGPSKLAKIMNARFEAVAEIRRIYPHRSLPWLGQQLGGRDHTTMMSALRKMGLK